MNGDGDQRMAMEMDMKPDSFWPLMRHLEGYLQTMAIHDISGMEKALACLTAREAEVVRMRVGLPPYPKRFLYGKIGQAMGFSRERARQVYTKSYRKIAATLRHRVGVIEGGAEGCDLITFWEVADD